jgi:hypothetical protein
MARIYLVLSIILSSLTGCWAGEYAEVKDSVYAEDEESADIYTWDFGAVEEGEVLTHAFILQNESAKTLTIKDVTTSCGCTASEVKKKILASRETTSIGVKFNSQGYSGPVKQFVYINTDDLDNPLIRYIIKADVIRKQNPKSKIPNPK